MAVVALTNIYDGLKNYVPGEVIEGLTDKEERRLVELKYAEAVAMGEKPPKPPRKKA